MKKNLAIIFLTFSIFFSCSSGHNKTQHSGSFKKFLKKFRTLQLPLTFRHKLGAENFDYSRPSSDKPTAEELRNLSKFDESSTDSLFIKEGTGTIYYGMLPDTSNYYGLIVVLGAVENEPVFLKTYSKSGKLISEAPLGCVSCVASIDLEWCSSTGIIEKDLTIYSADTVKTAKRDGALKTIDGAGEFYFILEDRKINSAGKIITTGHKRMDIKK